MQIKDLANKLGISEATVDKLIKKPDNERLLWPHKNANGYYDYSENEVTWLKRYKVLRAVDLKYCDFLAIEHGEHTLQDVLKRHCEALQGKVASTSHNLELCQRLLDAGFEYESLPVDELFDEYCHANASMLPLDHDNIDDTSPISLERVIFCPCCGKRIIVDLADYVYNDYTNEEPMGTEIVYEYNTEDMLICPECHRVLQVSGYTSEYPIGGYNYERITLTARVGG